MKTIINCLYVLGFVFLLTLAFSLPDVIYLEYNQNYSGLTEAKHEPLLKCTDFETHKETMAKIEK